MHVVVDARLADQRPGGIATYSRELCHALAIASGRHRLTVLRHRHAARWPLPTTVTQRRTLTPPHHRWEGITLGLEVAALRPGLVHTTDVVPPLVDCPRVTTVHDVAFLRWPEVLGQDGRRYYGQIHQAVSTADHIIVVSVATRRDLVNYLGVATERVTVVPQGVSASFRPLPPPERTATSITLSVRPAVAALIRDDSAPYFLHVGTIEPRKNLPMLLTAYARLAERWPAAPRLVLAGRDGWLADDTWQTLSRLSVRERVTWVDGPTTEELVLLYCGARALVFPSRYEGFGLPALEAMACGTPVLASDGSALREVVGDAGWLLPVDDTHAWADAMELVSIDDMERTRLVAAGRARAALYSWKATAMATLAVYDAVLSHG